MKKNLRWKLLILLAACIGILAFAVPAAAATLGAGSEGVTTANLNMRKTASSSGTLVTTIPKGRTVMITAVSSDKSWFKVNYCGKVGYVSVAYLKSIDSLTSVNWLTTRVMAANIRLRSSASSSAGYYKINGSKYYIPRGKRVILLGTSSDGKWYKVSSYGYVGYIQKGYFTTEVKTATVAKKVNFRVSPSTSAAKVTSSMLPVGTKVTVFSYSSGWYYCGVTINNNFKMGYIKNGYFKTSTTGTTKTTKAKVNLRKGAGTSYDIYFAVPKGKTVTVLATYTNGWSRVTYNGTTGYMMSSYLQ